MKQKLVRLFSPRSEPAGFWLYALHVWTVFGLAISNLFLTAAAFQALRRSGSRKYPWRQVKSALLPLVLFIALLVCSAVVSYEPRTSLLELRQILSYLTFPLAFVLVRGRVQTRKLVDVLIGVVALLAIFGLAQFFTGSGQIFNRIRGPFSHYMTFAGILLIADMLLIAQMICGKGWQSWWRRIALVVINLALLGSLTRSSWVALGLTFTVLLILRAPRYLAAYLPAAVLFIILAPVPLLHRVISIGDLADTSNYDRVCMVEAGLKMIRERPLFGLGPGVVRARYPLYRHPSAPRALVPHLHNTFLQIGADSGLLSLGAYLWFMGVALCFAYRRYDTASDDDDSDADLFMGVFLGLAAFNIAGFFENNWGDTEVHRIVLFVAAVPFCLANRGQEADREGAALG